VRDWVLRYIYDLEDETFAYALDRRHASSLKEQFVCRQGVQWTDLQLKQSAEKLQKVRPQAW
jgi:hypothetical protein